MILTGAEQANRIDALLEADNFGLSQWYTAGGAPAAFTYQFETTRRADFPGTWSNVSDPLPFTEAEKAAIRQGFDAYAQVLNIRFTEVTNNADPNFSVYNAADLDTTSSANVGGRGRWQYFGTEWDGAMVFRADIDLAQDFYLIIHELGHMLGLKHPGDYDVLGGGAPPPFLPSDEDNQKYTVMSYLQDPATNEDATGLMLYDLLAAQHFWGANAGAGVGATVYTPFDQGDLHVIDDRSGLDLMMHSGTGKAVIDLRQGAFSSLGGEDLAVIAYGTVIENATGGNGWDRITGNEADNSLSGGRGRDTLSGLAGDDILEGGTEGDRLFGGEGLDTASYAAAAAGVRASLTNAGANTGEAAGDHYNSIENLTGSGFRDLLLANRQANRIEGGAGNDSAEGRAGDDVLLGGDGNDLLRGGIGKDVLTGGAGFDRLEGGGGDDVLTGGAQVDLFVFTKGADRITDFDGDKLAFDDVLWGEEPRGVGEVMGSGRVKDGDVIFNFGSGNRLILEDFTDLAALEQRIEIF